MKVELKSFLSAFLFVIQRIMCLVGYAALLPFSRFIKRKHHTWAVGTEEIAGMLHHVAQALPGAISVNFNRHPYYSHAYTYSLGRKQRWRLLLLRVFYAPLLFSYLAHAVNGFFYIGNHGFLFSDGDGRKFEFAFLRKRGKRIGCCFTGTDIRSIRKSIAFGLKNDIDVFAKYLAILQPHVLSDRYEEGKKRLAQAADRYADIILNFDVDQISYLTRQTYPFLYFYPDEFFDTDDSKFSDLSIVRIVHAPSSPFIKGTPLVRAAVKKLRLAGYAFQYTELIGVPHEQVLGLLRSSHIVVNELYSFVPGVLGVEAMANNCVLLTSADPALETSLPPGANEAWLVTRYWEIYDHLKKLLDEPELMRDYARRGNRWAFRYCSRSRCREQLLAYLRESIGGHEW